jgi:hypothetical protein
MELSAGISCEPGSRARWIQVPKAHATKVGTKTNQPPAWVSKERNAFHTVQCADIDGDGALRLNDQGMMVVAPSWQPCKSFFTPDLMDHGMAQWESLGRKDFLDIIDRVILPTQLKHAFAGSVSSWGTLGAGLLGKEEREAAAAQVATKEIEGRWGIAELLCRLGCR